MERIKRHIACFLLAVFSLVAIPAPLLHEIFANHMDVADNHCHFYHKGLGKHIEEKQNHCDIFKADTPVYHALKVEHDFQLSLIVISEYKTSEVSPCSFVKILRLPARAPPLA